MAKPYNPLAPLTPKQLHQMALKYTRAQFGPVLSQINQGYAQRSRAGAASIQQGTSALAASYAPQAAQTHQIYAEAQSAQSAIDNAIASKLAAAGQTAQADVGGQLASAGIGPSPTNLAQVGAGAGAASFGMGSAALSRLVAEGAARENYSASLPGIARSGGAYRAQDLALQLEHGRQGEVQSLQAKLPGTVASIEQNLQQNEFNKAAANLTYTSSVNKLNETSAYHAATIQTREDAINATNARAKATAASKGRVYNQNLSRAAGYAVDGQGRPILNPKTGNPYKFVETPKGGKGGKSGGLTTGQLEKKHNYALEATKALKHGVANPFYDPKSDGYHKGVSDKTPRTYPTGSPADRKRAFKYLINHKVPRDMALNIIGKVYGPVGQ